MLSEYIPNLANVSFHIAAYMYARFRYSGKNPMRFAVFWRISVRFCGFRTPLTPPSFCVTAKIVEIKKEVIFDGEPSLSYFRKYP